MALCYFLRLDSGLVQYVTMLLLLKYMLVGPLIVQLKNSYSKRSTRFIIKGV